MMKIRTKSYTVSENMFKKRITVVDHATGTIHRIKYSNEPVKHSSLSYCMYYFTKWYGYIPKNVLDDDFNYLVRWVLNN